MENNNLQVQDVAYNIKRHLKRVGVGILTFSLCASTVICLHQENDDSEMLYKGIIVSEELGVQDTLATTKASYEEIAVAKAESVALARMEGTEKAAEDEALAEEQRKRDLLAAEKLEAKKKETEYVADSVDPQDADSDKYGEYLGTFTVTAYCPCARCCGKSNGITASGKKAKAGRTIATSSQFSFGTKLVVGGKVYTVEDRGGAIKGNRIDIFFASHKQALQFGRRKMKVYRYN